MTEIDIKGLDKPTLFRELYNNAQVQGMGGLSAKPGPMSLDVAKDVFNTSSQFYFDYVYGRVMKVDLSGDTLDPRLYDRDNGEGMCEFLVNRLKGLATSDDNPQPGEYRPERCQLDPMMLMAITMGDDKTPCDGCNMDRSVCNGGPHKGR